MDHVRTAFLILVALPFAALPAQSQTWTELTGVERDAILLAPDTLYVREDVLPIAHGSNRMPPQAIRSGQQSFGFDIGNGVYDGEQTSRINVSVDGGPYTTIACCTSLSGVIPWTSAPTAVDVYDVSIHIITQYNSNTAARSYTFKLAIVPAAQRVFRAREINHSYQRYTQPTSGYYQLGSFTRTIDNLLIVWQTGALDKVELIVEGIDSSNANDANGYFALGLGFLPRAMMEGADIAILDWGDGGRDMRQNANVLPNYPGTWVQRAGREHGWRRGAVRAGTDGRPEPLPCRHQLRLC